MTCTDLAWSCSDIIRNGGHISLGIRFPFFFFVSTSKAELVAASQAGQEALYLRETLKDFGYQQHSAIEINGDRYVCFG